MWIIVGILASFGLIVLVPVVVVGTWFVVMTVVLGLADGAIWLLDQGWKKNKKLPLIAESLSTARVDVRVAHAD
jgi:hypothetical protein